MHYRADIDGLRAIAVLGVLLYHAGVPSVPGGFVGVDVFFVISGYLITRLLRDAVERGTFTFTGFYLRRARRLLPAMLAMLALTLAAGWWLLPPLEMRALGLSAVSALLSLSNMLFWLQSGYFDTASDLKPLLHTWSLGVEEQFYVVWPALLLLLLRLRTRWRVGMIALAVVASVIACEWALGVDASAAFFFLPFRAFELGIGALLVFLPDARARRGRTRDVIVLAGLATIILSMLLLHADMRFPGIIALLPCLGTALVLHMGPTPLFGRLLGSAPLRALGLISYSLYLVHWPLIVFWRLHTDAPLTGSARWVLIALSIGLAAACYRWIERPFRHPSRASAGGTPSPVSTTPRTNTRFVIGIACASLAVGAVAIGAWRSDGWKGRYSPGPEVRALLEGRAVVKRGQQKIRNPVARIALVGDSHADHLYMGLVEWGEAQRVVVDRYYIGGGCPPLFGISVFGDTRQHLLCEDARDPMLEKIAAADHDAVILAARWGLYTGTLTAKDHLRPRSLSTDAARGDHGDLALSRAAFLQGLDATVRRFTQVGKRVLFVGEVPPLGRDPYACIEIQPTLADVREHCRNAPYDQVLGETAWSVAAAAGRQAQWPALSVFDPVPALCSDGACVMMDGDGMLYNDGNHVNNAGARRVVAAMAPTLDALLRDLPADASPAQLTPAD